VRNPSLAVLCACGLLGAAVAVMLYRSAAPAPAPRPTPAAPPTWVGSKACQECHGDQVQRWSGSHHALAMQEATQATILGSFDGKTRTHQGTPTSFLREGEGFAMRTAGPDGKERAYRVAYAFGVEPLQQYLLELPKGRLQPSPWAWDTRPSAEGGQRWFHLEPNEVRQPGDSLHWTGYEQTANHTCIECHVTRYELGYDLEKDRFQSRWLELGVACEACHGPGSAHVAWARTPERDTSQGRGLLAGKATASFQGQRADLASGCYRCHGLRSSLTAQLEPGVAFLDQARPRLLDAGFYHPDGQIDAEVFVYGSFSQSRMHANQVTCKDCHQPHDLSLRAEGNALCAQCHRPSVFDTPQHHFHGVPGKGVPGKGVKGKGAQCVDCHMPGKHYMVNDFRRDHRLAVPRPDLSPSLGTPNACAKCHEDKSAPWLASKALELWPNLAKREHFGAGLHAARAGDPRSLNKVILNPQEPGIARATALTLLSALAPAPVALKSVHEALSDSDPLVRAGGLVALGTLPPPARWSLGKASLTHATRLVRVEAARALVGLAPADASAEEREALARAISEVEEAELANPSRPESHANLANLYARLGRHDEAERSYRVALRLDPRSVPARVNLADLYRLLKREAEGLGLLEESIKLEPRNAEAHHALGLSLIRMGRKPEALEALRASSELRPDSVRFAYVYGVALQGAGRLGDARSVWEIALERRPGAPALLWALVGAARAQKDVAGLRRYAKELGKRFPEDPSVQELLKSLP
jgi:tetratricopeptide (TPR) repeat protein